MESRASPNATLGHVIELYLGPIENLELEDFPGNDMRTRGLANWYRFNYCLINKEHCERFVPLLSKQQREAYCLLYDWWTASYSDAAVSLASILDISDQCKSLQSLDCSPAVDWASVLSHLQLKRFPPPGDRKIEVSPPDRRPLTYDNVLWDLYKMEFERNQGFSDDEPQAYASRWIQEDRRRAAVQAWCQNTVWHCFHEALHDELGTHGCAGLYSTVSTKEHAGSVIVGKLRPRTQSFAPPVRSCPWLQNDIGDIRAALPYYLWDRKRMRTIRTDALEERPGYTAISHTWGRWVKPGTSIRVRGVPWSIPENTRFEVADLAKTLLFVPTDSEYIWFDLVCIPQDGSLVAQREIARQAEIFRGADYAVAWLNDVQTFEGLSTSLRWLALQSLVFADGSFEDEKCGQMVVDCLQSLQSQPSYLLQPRDGRLTKANLCLNSWFTSLWTLQELCLRPDMWLCSKDWRPLQIQGSITLSISGIAAILRSYEQHKPNSRMFPLDRRHGLNIALWELQWWEASTGLRRILNFSRTDIIAWGDQRQCTSRRAEAIMSALGATDWYTSSDPKTHNDNLVLGKYPVAFIRELAAKDPGEFFSSFTKTSITSLQESGSVDNDSESNSASDSDPDDEQIVRKLSKDLKLANTMLPISAAGGIYYDSNLAVSSFTPHESLQTWDICATGDVYMREACILASSRAEFQPSKALKAGMRLGGVRCRNAPLVDGRTVDTRYAPGFNIDLSEWVRTRTYEAHAVLLSHSILEISPNARLAELRGLILRRVNENLLMKLGNFYFEDSEGHVPIPQSKPVDWLVR